MDKPRANGNQKYQYDLNVFYNEDALSYYLLGVFMSDGNVRFNKSSWTISMKSKDKDWLIDIVKKICPIKGPDVKPVVNSTAHQINLNNKEIAEWLISKNCTPVKSLTLKFPEVPNEFLSDFMRGFIDGDGSILLRKDHKSLQAMCAIYCSSLSFMESFQTKLAELGFPVKISIDNRKEKPIPSENRIIVSTQPAYRIFLTGTKASRFIQYLYYPNHPLSLARKAEKASEIIQKYNSSTRKPQVYLTESNILQIKEMVNQKMKYKDIATIFNVSSASITNLVKGKTWKNLQSNVQKDYT